MTLTYPDQGVDLNSCDLEPIHIIGGIQPFGYLVALSSDWIVARASANCGALLGRPADEALGHPASTFFTPAAVEQIRQRLAELPAGQVERLFNLPLTPDWRPFDVAVYRAGRQFVLEIEPSHPGTPRDYLSLVRPMFDAARQASSLEDLCDIAARQMRRLTGFDRVKVYRFDETGAGEVVAEARGDQIDSFLGLHFPASDIPKQARKLYTQNLLRIIADIDAVPVPIHPALDADGVPLDLSPSGLRAVSPVHIEYLRNMGVKASMSVSILRGGQLWGLFACHHYAPLSLPYATRTAAELFGEFFSGLLEQMEIRTTLAQHETATRLHDDLTAQVAHGGSLLANFDRFADLIRQVIPFDGIVGYVAGDYVSLGQTPSQAQFLDLARFLNTTGNGACWSTHHLARVYPPAQAFGDKVCGLLAVPVSRVPRDFLVLFRREYAHEVLWAGDPGAPKQAPGPLGDRLTPRKSFALWKEERRRQSKPWSGDEKAIAEKLRVTLIEVILQLLDASNAEREASARRQQDLIAELNHRVRNSLNMIGAMVSQGQRSATSLADFCSRVSARIATLARAHDQVNATSWAPFPLGPLVHETVRAAFPESHGALTISGPQVLIRPSAFTTLAVVIHELVAHSTALATPEGQVQITLAQTATGALTLSWRESGGAATSPWQDRMALAIVERSIPHELSGEARVTFHTEGLEAFFSIPAERVQFMNDTPPPSPAGSQAGSGPAAASLLSQRALVVEDNIIIGMEAEDQLLALGAHTVDLANNVAQALSLIAANVYEFALLDVNLGNESSQPIAEVLQGNGTPYAFSTGYGEVPWAHGPKVPVVTKPLDSIALERAIVASRLP
ncbi:HWE histidine kinase domain-containing protein [Novosphingobium sp.]|uniref:HWE histidine kinase domain-containing protein n=1 Tax=Novosphingobium sp. TaxID=1874826 RepID=UPI0031E125E2